MNKLVKNALNDDSTVGGLLKQKVRLAKTEAMCINKHSDKTDDLTYLMMSTNRLLSDNYGEYVQRATGGTKLYLKYLSFDLNFIADLTDTGYNHLPNLA